MQTGRFDGAPIVASCLLVALLRLVQGMQAFVHGV